MEQSESSNAACTSKAQSACRSLSGLTNLAATLHVQLDRGGWLLQGCMLPFSFATHRHPPPPPKQATNHPSTNHHTLRCSHPLTFHPPPQPPQLHGSLHVPTHSLTFHAHARAHTSTCTRPHIHLHVPTHPLTFHAHARAHTSTCTRPHIHLHFTSLVFVCVCVCVNVCVCVCYYLPPHSTPHPATHIHTHTRPPSFTPTTHLPFHLQTT